MKHVCISQAEILCGEILTVQSREHASMRRYYSLLNGETLDSNFILEGAVS